MTKTLRFHRLAEDELADAVSWYEQRWEGLGSSLLDLTDTAIDSLKAGVLPTSPVLGIKTSRGARRVLLRRFPYSIVF